MEKQYDPEIIERLERLLDGELPPGDDIEKQLIDDEKLRKLYLKLAFERAAFREALKLHEESAESLPADTRSTRRTRRIIRRHRRPVQAGLLWAVAAAAAVIVVAGLYFWSQRQEGGPAPETPGMVLVDETDSAVRRDGVDLVQDLEEPDIVIVDKVDDHIEVSPPEPEFAEVLDEPPMVTVPPTGMVAEKQEIVTPAADLAKSEEPAPETATTRLAARVLGVDGALFRLVDGRQQVLKEGQWLVFGDEIVSRSATAVLSFGRAGRLVLGRYSQVKFETAERTAVGMNLADGRVYVEWSPADGALTVNTAVGKVEVLGTSFAVERHAGYDRVLAEKGRVRVSAGDESAEISGGEGVSLYERGPGKPFELKQSELLWAHRLLAVQVGEGRPISLGEGFLYGKGARVMQPGNVPERAVEWIEAASVKSVVELGRQGEFVRLRLSAGVGRRYLWLRARDDTEWGREVNAAAVYVNNVMLGRVVLPGSGKRWLWYRFEFSATGLDTVSVVAVKDADLDSHWQLPDGSPGYSVAVRLDCVLISRDRDFKPEAPDGEIVEGRP